LTKTKTKTKTVTTTIAGSVKENMAVDVAKEKPDPPKFDEIIDDVQPLPGAHELVLALKERGHVVVVASSAIERHLDVLFEKLAIRDLLDDWTVSDDVESSKPEPDLVEAALEKAGTRDAVMIGDSPWDIIAARRARIPTIALLTGGFATCELEGAVATYDSLDELRRELPRSALA
jgi:HAD superfamily hydrolase (TIGR01549 family)